MPGLLASGLHASAVIASLVHSFLQVITVPKFRYRKRTFLAPPSTRTTSYVFAEVESSNEGEYKHGHYMITLADCRRQIELEFSLGTTQSRRQSLAKIDLLIEILSAFRDALKEEAKLIEKLPFV